MKKILIAHYEKIILAVLLIIFAALLFYQVQVVQKVQNKEVLIKVNPVEPPSDYDPIDFTGDRKFRTENVFSDGLVIDIAADTSATATEMMTPYALAECVYCHTLIPAGKYPAIGQTKNGKCPACGKALAPRVKVEEDDLGKSDQNSNGIPDEWEKEMKISDLGRDSDEDSDGFTLIQEYKAKTDPKDPLSHPKYITMIYVSAISRQRLTGLELASVDNTKPDKKDWTATFSVVLNNRKRSAFVQPNVGTFKNNNVDYSVVDIEIDEKTQEPVVYLQRVGKIERIPCRIKQPVYDPIPRVRFINALYSNRTFIASVGANFKLGTAKTGEELYQVVSADSTEKTVVVESQGDTPETFTLTAAPAEVTAAATKPATETDGKSDDSPFLNQIK